MKKDFEHDFKYSIPEMDRLLGAVADLGIHFSYVSENISQPEGRMFLVQIANIEINETFLQLTAASHSINIRNGGKTIPFPMKDAVQKGTA